MTHTLFGTDGIRTRVGTHPLTIEALPKLGSAIAQWAQHHYGPTPSILIAHDTRISYAFVKAALKTGLLLNTVELYDGHILPTPAVYQAVKNKKSFDVGIVISASHNPYYDNGLKIIDSTHGKLDKKSENHIIALYNDLQHKQSFRYDTLGTEFLCPQAKKLYCEQLVKSFTPEFLRGKTIVLDCAHGATSHIAPHIFEQLGAQVHTIHNQPDGTNINKNCGALFPANLKKTVNKYKADAGFAFDGDGDRLITVNKHGDIKDGDDILALLLDHPRYASQKAIVGTLMTNQGLELHLKQRQKQLIRVPVGDKHVARKLQQEGLMLGGEPSGHTILNDYLTSSDGIFTALRVLETIKHTDNWDMITFVRYPQILINVPISVKKNLQQEPFATHIASSEKKLHAGRLIVRYSGTENVLRVMIEDSDYEHAQTVGRQLVCKLQKELTKS